MLTDNDNLKKKLIQWFSEALNLGLFLVSLLLYRCRDRNLVFKDFPALPGGYKLPSLSVSQRDGYKLFIQNSLVHQKILSDFI